MKTLGFIGAGRITGIFLQAFKNKGLSLSEISIFDINNDISKMLKEKFPEIKISDLKGVSSDDVVFIALHPPVIMETLNSVKEFVKKDTVIISLAPKITIEKISTLLGNQNIVRLIPNATSIINQGYNPVCFSNGCGDKQNIFELLSALGKTFETQEQKLEAYAIASAMLPTYFWFQWFELIEIAAQIGLSDKEALETVEETIIASINTAFKSGLTQKEVCDLIPVKPIGENEIQIKEILNSKLKGLYEKIKP